MKVNRIAAPALLFLLGVTTLAVARTSASPLGSPSPVFSQDRDRDRGRDWDVPPGELNEIQRRGFRDGIEGARQDFENHRRPSVDNRDEYRRPGLSYNLWDAYQEGFRRGYAVGVSHLMQAPLAAPPPSPIREPDRSGWDAVQGRTSDHGRLGYQDGMDAARRDAESHRRPDPENRDEYRAPRVPPELRDDYREGFRRGYEEGVAQMAGRQEQGPWDAAPGEFSEIQRRGFQDGMDGARRDVENHRRPDPNNRDEYRNPNVPPRLVDEYREGFRRGYERAMAHLMGDPDRR
jgi:hypothetical protein